MNRKAAAKAIVLLQAYVSGRQIEYKMHGSSLGWNETDGLQGNFLDRDYRVKPKEPRIEYLNPINERIAAIELTDEVKEALEKAGISYDYASYI